MSSLTPIHERHGATFTDRGGRQLVAHYGRPERTHLAVRNGVGFIEQAEDILVISGADRIDYVDNIISNRVPHEEGAGTYALLLNPHGRIRVDLYVFNAGERLLVFLPPGEGEAIAADWNEKTFIQDVTISFATPEFSAFGVHGPNATEKIASVFSEMTPETRLSFTRGSMGDVGVTVVRMDGLTGEEGYAVICDADATTEVFDTLENRGLNAVPFGYRTWETLTLEAGTPLFESELSDQVPNNLGLHNAVDYEKGCFVGQEVVSRVANRGRPTKRLVGIETERVPDGGAAIFEGDDSVGTVTRAVHSPTLDRPIGLALVNREVGELLGTQDALSVRIEGDDRPATPVALPFVEGSERSGRLPQSGAPVDR